MDELVENPEGCRRFEPNQFKKEKCKSCGRPWFEHKGVITEEQVKTFVSKKEKALDEQKKKEADAKEKVRAKQLAKKKQTQAVEDEWLFDGNKEVDSIQDSDDDCGFQMFVPGPESLDRPERKVDNKPLKVVNLIDFTECDVVTEDHTADAGASRQIAEQDAPPLAPAAGGAPPAQGSPMRPAHGATPNGAGEMPRDSLTTAQPMYQDHGMQEELLAEIEDLRQMLADANEEKSIQVAIVRDEVIEKQQLLDSMTQQRKETEVQLSDARDRVGVLEARAAAVAKERDEALQEAESRRAQAELSSAEAQNMRAQVEQQGVELAQLREESNTAEVEQLRAELEQLRKAPAGAEVEQLREELARLREEAASRREEAAPGTQVQAPPSIPPSVAETIAELREVVQRTQEILGGSMEHCLAPEDAVNGVGELEAGLRGLLAEFKAVHTSAQHASAERRQLAIKLRDSEKAALSKRGIYSEPTPVRNGVILAEEQQAAAQDMISHRAAAQALKEMRMSAEQQLAWISKRMRMGRQAPSGCIDSPADLRQGVQIH